MAVLLAVAAPSHAVFSPPHPVTTGEWRGEQASALFRDGSSLTVALVSGGTGSGEVQVVQRPAGAAPSEPVAVSRPGSAAAFRGDDASGVASGLGSNRSGDAVIVWTTGGTVMAVSRHRDGSLGKPESIAPGIDAAAAMTPRGDAIVFFETDRSTVRAAIRPRGAARFQAPRTLSASPAGIHQPTLHTAMLRAYADGFVALWTSCTAAAPATKRHFAACERFRPNAARISADGRTAFVRNFDVPWRPWSHRMQLVNTPSGDALALLTATRGRGGVVRVAHSAANHRFGPAHVISRPARTAIRAVAGSASGGGYVAWVERTLDGTFRIVGTDLSPNLDVGRPVGLSPSLDKLTLPRVQVGTDGSAAVFWPSAARGTQPPISWRLRSRRGHDRFAPSLTLAAVDRLAVAVDPLGAVIALTAVNVPPRDSASISRCLTTAELRSAVWAAGSSPRFRTLDSSCAGIAPVLAMNADGTTLAVWGRFDGGETGSLRTAVRRQNGDFGAATTALSGTPLSFSTARLDGGHAAVVWNAASRRLFASFDDDLLADAP